MSLDVRRHRLHVFVVFQGVAVHGRAVARLGVDAGGYGDDQRVQPRVAGSCGGALLTVVRRRPV
ncbi:hypothetical protein AB0N06_33715 [Streptomyces sp. NPDC051020]|uniref:hypothetical protein n=1 Tax=Streptomyces sp. NPDC051020 TaxID=3155409 RepID=UPI00342D44D9